MSYQTKEQAQKTKALEERVAKLETTLKRMQEEQERERNSRNAGYPGYD